jgi:hypothetical protein
VVATCGHENYEKLMPVLELEPRTAIVSPTAELAWRGMESALRHAGVNVALPANASEVLPASNDPKRKAAHRKATAAILRGAGLTQYGSSDEALALFDSALQVLPKEFWAHFGVIVGSILNPTLGRGGQKTPQIGDFHPLISLAISAPFPHGRKL